MRIMLRAGGNHEPFAGLYLARRLAFDQDFALAFDDVTDLIPRMCMPARSGLRRQFDARNYRFPAGHRNVRLVHHGPLNSWILAEEGASGREKQGARSELNNRFHAFSLSYCYSSSAGTSI